MIGIIQVHHRQMILVGPPLQVTSLFTTHVRLVGAFLMVVKTASGQRLMVPQKHIPTLTTAIRKVMTSPAISESPPLYGTLSWSDAVMRPEIFQVTTQAVIGHVLLLVIWFTTCTLAAPMSILRHTPFARLDSQSVAARNDFSRGWHTGHPLLLYRERGYTFLQLHVPTLSKTRRLAWYKSATVQESVKSCTVASFFWKNGFCPRNAFRPGWTAAISYMVIFVYVCIV